MKKSLEQQIKLVMEGQANAATLEYGSDLARDTYAKDTPGQTPGVDHNPIQHQHKSNLALDGVPVPGGTLKKPNFEKDAGMGKVAEAKDEVKNCGCGKDPCETYGSKEEQMKKEEAELDEAGRWENTSQGRAYRRLSPEEKARKAKANMLNRRSGAPKSRAKAAKVGIGRLKSVYKGTTRREQVESILDDLSMAYTGTLISLDEAVSDSERKQAAAKIFRMHQAKQAAKQASSALGKKSDPAAKAARRDSAGYKTSDDSHLDKKPSTPEKKRGRGERDLPHIVSQLRGVVDTKDGAPASVKFKDGSTKNVKPKHAASWLKKHDSAKPAEKLAMYKSHDNHSAFKSHAKEEVVNEISKGLAGRYIKRAVGDAISQADKTQYHTSQMFQKQDAGDKKGANKEFKKAEEPKRKTMNRFYGVQRAASKMDKKDKNSGEYLAHSMTKQKTSGKVKATEAVDSKDKKGLKKLVKGLKGSSAAHMGQMKDLEKMIKDHYIPEGSKPNNPKLWAAKKAAAKSKFDVYPSAYANGWAAKAYKKAGGTWRSESVQHEEKMTGQEYRTQMAKVKSKDPAIRKAISNVYDKKSGNDVNHPEVKAAKKYMKSEANLQELSPELIKKVAHKRNVNVSMAGSKADYDRRDPDYQKAAEKQSRNQKLRFSAGAKAAKKIGDSLSKSINK